MSYKIEKQDNGKYKIRVWSRIDEFGKRKTKQMSDINSVALAKNIALEFEESLNSDEDKKDYTFAELQELYDNTKAKNLSPNTKLYKQHYKEQTLNKWGAVKVSRINTKNVQEWVNELEKKENPHKKGQKLKESTIKEYVKCLNTVINWAAGIDLIDYNRIKKIEYKEDEEEFEPTLLSPETLKELLEALKRERYNLYIPTLISLLADPRRGEVLGLTWNDIDFEKGIIYLNQAAYQENGERKTKKKLKSKTSKRGLIMSDFLKQELLKHKNLNKYLKSNFICDNIFIGTITPSYLTHQFHDFVKQKFNINIRFHDLRHNFNQICFENGVDLSTRSKMLGHANEKITNDIYTHYSHKKSKEAVELITTSLGLNKCEPKCEPTNKK